MSSPLRDLVKRLESQGVTVRNGARHNVLVHQSRIVGILPRDLLLDDKSAYRKTISQLRRAGLRV